MVKVKICGITNIKDALCAAKFGADAIGFVFYKKSPRYICPQKARGIIKKLPKAIKKTGVFVNARHKTVSNIAESLGLDILQFHGNETQQFCKRFKNYRVIKAFRIKKGLNLSDLYKYDVWAYLLDTFIKNKFGGTGKSFDWNLLDSVKACKKIIFLSGGLNPKNVRKALSIFPAQWVDASSSLEEYPGKKDPNRIKEFIRNAKP